MEWKVPVVIHDEFGGFGLTPEMVRRLKDRGCKWVDKCGHDHNKTRYWLPSQDGMSDEAESIRMDKDLIAVVRELTEEYEKIVDRESGEILSWREKTNLRQEMLANLKIVQVRIDIEIEDFDGRESVSVTGGAW